EDDVPSDRLDPPHPDVGTDRGVRPRCRDHAGIRPAADRRRAPGGEAVLPPDAAGAGVLLSPSARPPARRCEGANRNRVGENGTRGRRGSLVRDPVRRAEAAGAGGHGLGAGGAASLLGRADDRARPVRAPRRVGCLAGPDAEGLHGPVDDALPRRGRGALGAVVHRRGRPHPLRRDRGRSETADWRHVAGLDRERREPSGAVRFVRPERRGREFVARDHGTRAGPRNHGCGAAGAPVRHRGAGEPRGGVPHDRRSLDRCGVSEMAFGLRWGGTGVFLATEIRVQFHEWLAIVTGTLTPGALLPFVAVLAPDLLAVTPIGYVVSTLFKDMKTIWPYSALLTNLFGIVPPVFYPIRFIPTEWRSVVLLLPTSGAAVLVNSAAGLETISGNEAILAAAALAVESVAMFVFGIYWARRMARER